MQNHILNTKLFSGCAKEDINELEKRLDFRVVRYGKGSVIYAEGDAVTDIGLVLSGSVRLEHTDLWGNKSILGITASGGVFAEAYACMPDVPMMVDAVANEECEVLFISAPKLLGVHPACKSQGRLIQNLLLISAAKNQQLSRRSLHTSPKTIRGRLLSYFSEQVVVQKSGKIKIPFDRQQLADYLNLDRSALSKELGKMRKDGLIAFHKNIFEIKIALT